MTQQDAIVKYIKTHKRGITSKDAIEKFGCTRLSAVIATIERTRGLKIDHKREKVEGRYGPVSITRYTLLGDA